MLVRIDKAKGIAAVEMRVFDVEGSKVNVESVGGQLHAFDDSDLPAPLKDGFEQRRSEWDVETCSIRRRHSCREHK